MISQYKVKTSTFLFYQALFLWILNFMLGQAALPYPPNMSKIGQLVVTIILILRWMVEKRITLVKMVCIGIISVVCSIVYLTGGYGALFTGVFLAISSKDVDFRGILKFLQSEMLVVASILLLLSQFGVIPDYMYAREAMGDITLAHSLGFTYYAMPASIIMTSTIVFCYLRKGKCGYVELFTLGIINYLLYRLHTTRLTFFSTILFLLGYIIVYKLKLVSFKSRFWLIVATVAPMLFMLLNFILVILSINGSFGLTNEFFGTFNVRFELAGKAFQRYGLHLFGIEIETAGRASVALGNTQSDIYIDSGYMEVLLRYGILFSIMLLILYTLLFRYLYKKEDKFCYLWLGILLAISIPNNFLTNPIFNPIMFMVPKVIFENLSRNKKLVSLTSSHESIYDVSRL